MLGEASQSEAEAVIEWLNENPENKVYYAQLKKIWDNSKQLAAESKVDVDKAWEKFRTVTIHKHSSAKETRQKRFSWISIAALFILFAGAGIITFFILNSSPKQLMTQTDQLVLTDTLPDGTEITLNKKSAISYPSKFKGDTRSVTMTGEAFFKVVPDKKNPFVISVNDMLVTVVGTSFNIKSENGNTEVVVETGIVKVANAYETIELRAGERILMTPHDSFAVKQQVTDKLYNYYRSKEFVCDDTPLWKLVQVLNEAYDVQIVIKRKELNDLRLNTTFINESLDKVLEVIHLTFDLTVTRNDNGQIILE